MMTYGVASPADEAQYSAGELGGTGALRLGSDSPLRTTGLLRRWTTSQTEQQIVQATLEWCSEVFGTPRARFVRRYPDGSWMVHSVVQGKLVGQAADRAEIAMAWMVGLTRHPLRVTRPRVTTFDGAGVRPIAVTNYLGIPIICRDEFMGVIEAAGNVKPEADMLLPLAEKRLQAFAERLVHDPALRFDPLVDADTLCELGGGSPNLHTINLTGRELALLDALDGPLRLGDLAAHTGYSVAEVLDIAHGLVSRSLVSLRAPTRLLATAPAKGAVPSELNAAG